MEIKREITIKLTKEDVAEAIKLWLKENEIVTSEKVAVKFNIETALVGYGMAENEETRFDGVSVTIN